jgi:hypothetical protein
MTAERLPARALEVQAGGVHEPEIEPAEQVAPMGEQPLLDQVLGTARRVGGTRGLFALRQFLAEPRHRPMEMVELQRLDPTIR